MRGLWLLDGCKTSQVHAITPERTTEARSSFYKGSKFLSQAESTYSTSRSAASIPPPQIEPYFKPLDYVETLAAIHAELEAANGFQKSGLYLEQSFVFRGLRETKLVRRSLRSARRYATTVHEKLVYAAWIKYEKRGEEVDDISSRHSSRRKSDCCQPAIPSCDFNCTRSYSADDTDCQTRVTEYDVTFHIHGEKIKCNRQRVAALSTPFHVMLNGCFAESRAMDIDFSENGISAAGMNAVESFSRTGRLGCSPDIVLELLSFANTFCCEGLKEACDRKLATLVRSMQDGLMFMEYGLEERAPALVAACLQVILLEMPHSLRNPVVSDLFCKVEGRKRLKSVGHVSFALYSFLSQAVIEDEVSSDVAVLLLERLRECATTSRQRIVALHQLACVKLARRQYMEAYELFEGAGQEGHVYSLAGVARVKYRRGHRNAAYNELTALISCFKPTAWMYQERSLYCHDSKEKLADLNKATEMDPTLTYPYKHRAMMLKEEEKLHAAITEINRVLSFKVRADCLELRFHFCLALKDYDGAVRDLRAVLTLCPSYVMCSGRVAAEQLLELISQHVQPWTAADCWMQLYDRWSSVDDIGSLAVVHQMLQSDPGKGLLFFRQSLLLLRLNCPKAAMRSLRLARENASSEHEKLVYEGWILYDAGHRDEALQKADQSIAIQRSFEAFFLKAYALADTSLDSASSSKVIALLEEALKCPSDGLRKGQALNNLGSVFVDSSKYELAADCYISALKIRHTRAHQGLARVRCLQGNRKSAYEEMTKLIEKARNNASAYEKRSEYCDRDMTMADLSMVSQLDPLRTYPYRYRAAVLMDNHREKEAIAELSKTIAFKADLQLLHLRAAFYDFIGDFPAAVGDCRAALTLDPTHTDTLELFHRVYKATIASHT